MIAPWALNKPCLSSSAHKKFYTPIRFCPSDITPLTSRGDKPLILTLDHQSEYVNEDELPFVGKIVNPGQTAILDREIARPFRL